MHMLYVMLTKTMTVMENKLELNVFIVAKSWSIYWMMRWNYWTCQMKKSKAVLSLYM